MSECAFCFKRYKHRTHLVRHERICGLTHHRRTCHDDDEPLPSVRQLYEVALHLLEENKRLKEKVGRLTIKQQREWSLDEALGGAVPRQTFREWRKALTARSEHLECAFEHGRTEGIVRMAKELVATPHRDLPIRAFQQRKDTVYAYGEDGKWSKLDSGDLTLLINTFDKMLRVEFARWQDANSARLGEPAFQEEFLENMRKLNGRSTHGEATKVKRAMYEILLG